ncbi:MAG: hypothetical protein ACK4YQ_18895 [Phenylobacterium sp.]|uniref:hypothetical protein n=1 Tax=Phenylobacterium sp. TaxID=1871053 RepID=UPI00391B1F6B
MATKLLIGLAASALFAAPALAQDASGPGTSSGTDAMGASPPATSTTAADPNWPSSKPAAKPAARTGTAADTSGVVAMSDLRTGAAVRDASGARIGTIAKVKPGKAGGAADVVLDVDGQMTTVPSTSLGLSGGNLVSSKTKAQIMAGSDR